MNEREIAYQILYKIINEGAYSNLTLNKYLKKTDIEIHKKNFIRELVYGTLENYYYLRWIIKKKSDVKYKKIEKEIQVVLLLSLYQFTKMNQIPEHAICNEAVKLTKKYAKRGSDKFVNAIMRSAIRDIEKIEADFEKLGKKDKLSIEFSYPFWIIEYLSEQLGMEKTVELVKHSNDKPEFSIRTNTLKISREKLKENISNQGFVVFETEYAKDGLIIENPAGIFETDEFKNGFFTIQDESSMLVAQIMDAKKGELILDVCSAPGGKATHIAQMIEDEGMVVAQDLYSHKIKLIEENRDRLGIENLQAICKDIFEMEDKDTYDCVLADVPCSGLGIVRRKPELKWWKSEKELQGLISLQKRILEKASKQVKNGGTIIYSTCSVNPKENIEIVKKFLEENPNFELVSFNKFCEITGSEKGYLEIYYDTLKMDGFFIAKMKKH